MFVNGFIPAAFFVAAIASSYKVQFQALMYLFTVIFAVTGWDQFIIVTVLFLVAVVFTQLKRGAAG